MSVSEDSLFLYLVILAAGAKPKDEQVSMGVRGCKMLPIRAAFAVEQCSVPLALDLFTQTQSETAIGAHSNSLHNSTRQPQQLYRKKK